MRRQLRRHITSTTARLAMTYLLIIMLMSIGFSVVFYKTSVGALHRQVPPHNDMFHSQPLNPGDSKEPTAEVREFLRRRAAEGQRTLMIRLIILNSGALVVGGALSIYLSRRTLRPIERAMEAQAQFVSDASHELRTPLTVIQTSNEVALRNPKLNLAAAKEVIKENTEEAVKLQRLSDGLLNLAKQDQQAPKLTAVSIQAAVGEAMNEVLALAQAKQIAIDDRTDDLSVQSSHPMLVQVLVILLDNAIKYSPEQTNIELTTERKNDRISLLVTDHGIGIRASDMGHIFRRFYRADSARSSGNAHGYGLGLAIADSLLKRHGAAMSVTSELGKGSTFTIRMPYSKR